MCDCSSLEKLDPKISSEDENDLENSDYDLLLDASSTEEEIELLLAKISSKDEKELENSQYDLLLDASSTEKEIELLLAKEKHKKNMEKHEHSIRSERIKKQKSKEIIC